jgi:small conductance mechanosensitive channel
MRQFFSTHSHSWRDVGLARQLSRRAVKRARIQSLVLLPVLVGVLVVYGYREQLFGPAYDSAARIVTFLVLISLGWQFARDIGRALGPTLFRRMDPGTAGTVGFLLRLVTMLVAVLIALRVAGLGPRTLALGGAFTAVVVGLAAQQTLGNLFAGMVLLSARPFRVGERVRLQGGGLAGTVEGVVSSLGLLYTTLASGDDSIMVPNSVVLNVAIVPLREPEKIDLRARLRPGITPLDVQEMLQSRIETPLRETPRIALEEVDGDEVIVRISATPERPADGPQLAGEVLEVVGAQTVRDTA